MRFHVKYDRDIQRYTVHDRNAANQTIGIHSHVSSAQAHADAEESLWKRYGDARHAASVYERHKSLPWVA